MKTISDIIKNLLKVKSLFSLTAMGMFIYTTIVGILPIEVVASILTTIIFSYFNKKEDDK